MYKYKYNENNILRRVCNLRVNLDFLGLLIGTLKLNYCMHMYSCDLTLWPLDGSIYTHSHVFLYAGQVVRSIITVNFLQKKCARRCIYLEQERCLLFNSNDFCLSFMYLFLVCFLRALEITSLIWHWFTVYLWVYQGHPILPVLFPYLTRRPAICLLLCLPESILSDIRPIFTSICPHFKKLERENNSHFYES